MIRCGPNNLLIPRYPIKASPVKWSGSIDIDKQQKLVPEVNPTKMASLNFTKVHNFKSILIKPFGPRKLYPQGWA